MDSMLCDELIIEILQRLPPSPPPTPPSLVSKRWLRLFRHSRTTLSLSLHHHHNHQFSLSTFLLHFPFLSSLSLSSPVSLSTLFSLSNSSPHLTSLTIPLSRPLNLSWVPSFRCLKHLSLLVLGETDDVGDFVLDDFDGVLELESFSVSGLSWADVGLGWIWRNCAKLKRVHLRSCDGVGDGGSYSEFSKCLMGLSELELRSCRSIADVVLLKLGENSTQLSSLLVYDGGSKDGLLQFINSCRSNLRKLDLRLPLDLDNEHLSAMSARFSRLSCLKLQSCCLVTGDGLKAFSSSLSDNLEELALINCDVVERVPGLLTTMGQNLRNLRRLNLSYNEMLIDKELVSMLVSCISLVELNLRGCKGLTDMALVSMVRICKNLEIVDIVNCGGIKGEAVDLFVSNSQRLKRVHVEQNKLSDHARILASNRFIEVVG